MANRQGLLRNRYVIWAIAACIPLQLAYTHAPAMQAIFGSTELMPQEWVKVVAAGLFVFCVAELEKLVIFRTPLARRMSHAPGAIPQPQGVPHG